MKQKCVTCKRSVQLLTCDGCQQTFCNEHSIKHREDLSNQMNHMNQEYHHFKEDLNNNDSIQSTLSRIDQWERESIEKIQKTAENARKDLVKMFDRMKTQLKSSVEKIDHDMQSIKDYTEINLNHWTEQLKQLRHIHQTVLTKDILTENQSSIPLIRIHNKKQAFTIEGLQSFPQEKFDKKISGITLSQDRLTVTCTKDHWNGSTISGNNLYVSGIHSIRFRIIKLGKNNPFFGISSILKEPNPWNRKTPFAYGWWKLPLNKDQENNLDDTKMKAGDEVTLTLNCTNNEIEFEHHRTKQYAYETISYEQCPFPWKIAIVLYSPGDAISILP